jgi:hypothetical protein
VKLKTSRQTFAGPLKEKVKIQTIKLTFAVRQEEKVKIQTIKLLLPFARKRKLKSKPSFQCHQIHHNLTASVGNQNLARPSDFTFAGR